MAIYATRAKPRRVAKVSSRRRQIKALEVYLDRGSISAVSRVVDINFQSAEVLVKRAVQFLMDNPGHPKTELLLRYKAKELAKAKA